MSERGEVVLRRREHDGALELRVNGVFVMDTIETSSERELARATLAAVDPATDALEVLVAAPYRVLPSSDRVGTRLGGAALPRVAGYREVSRPMIVGALEVPRDGQPIVLGPEHPTTGGYPILAVIATAELGHFHAIRLGGMVRFAVAAR